MISVDMASTQPRGPLILRMQPRFRGINSCSGGIMVASHESLATERGIRAIFRKIWLWSSALDAVTWESEPRPSEGVPDQVSRLTAVATPSQMG